MKLQRSFSGTKMHLLGFNKTDSRPRTSILLIRAHKIKNPILLLSSEFEFSYRGHFTKLEGRSADQNFTRARTIDGAAGARTRSSGSVGRVLPSAGVYEALKNSDFAVIADIVKNNIERSRISKICFCNFLCLPNTSTKLYLFFCREHFLTPNKFAPEPQDFFRFFLFRGHQRLQG